MDPIVQINNLSYSYRRQQDRPALQGVTLEISAGEFVAIAGRAGSGKSTLCYALNGLIPHSFGGRMTGEVFVCGLNTRAASVPQMASRVGFVMQNAESQLVGLSVEEDAAFGLENIGLPREEVARRVQAALRMVGLEQTLHRSPWTLSGGQKQRLSIAAAIAFQPDVLVLDNPTAELDPAGKEEVMATLARLNSELGVTVVIVNQELEEVLPYASRLILIDAGRIVCMGSPASVVDRVGDVHRAGVKLPEAAQVADALRTRGSWALHLPLTVDEAADKLREPSPARRSTATSTAPADPSGELMIQMENVSFSYPGGKPVLSGVTLTVRRGEFVTLMGPNGAGKTTLAKHMNGLLIPTAGRVLVRGVDTRVSRVANLAKTVGYVFQNPDHQLFSRTTFEELSFGPQNLGWSKSRVQEAVRRGLDQVGSQGRGKEDPFFMGLAERKLVAIASVLTMGPDVLVLDEPATGADHHAALRIMSYLSQLHHQGLTIVIVTHDVSLAANYADRIVVLRSGTVALDGTPHEILQRPEQSRICSVTPPKIATLAQKLDPSLFTCRVDESVQGLVGGTVKPAAIEGVRERGALRSRSLDPRVKILYVLWVFLMVSVMMHPLILLLIFLVTVGVVCASELSLWVLAKAARFGLFIAAASWILWIVFLRTQGAVLFSLGPLNVTEPGVFNGWSVASRIAAILLAFLVVFKTTSNRQVMTALYRLRLSVPFAMVIGITLRLIPQLQAEHAVILEAQRSRAVEFDKGGLLARMRKHLAYIIPLVLRALKITSDLSIAMEARAFDPYAPRTFSEMLEFDSRDVVLVILMGATLLAAIGARVSGFGGMPAQWVAK